MSITANPVTDAIRHYDERARAADKVAEYMRHLRAETQQALLDDPQARIRTASGYPAHEVERPAADVILEDLTEQDMHEVLRLLGDAAKGGDVQLRALLLLSCWAERHAQTMCEIADAEGWIE